MSLIIVVADDDLPMRLFVSEYLEMCGYSVIAAEDGQAALELVEKYHPHLLVTDIMMPRMDGYELVRQVRQRPEFRLLPVVFLTEKNSTEERIRGYKLGCDSYLPKPFEIHELGAIIRNLLERSQIMQTEWHLRTQTPTLSGNANTTAQTTVTIGSLSERERQVLELITRGLSNIEIGDQLHLSPRTIEKYVSNLLRKTATSNRAELVRIAIEQRLVD
ncbi:response regulator transcription factor [Aerosakkonemataceae cyanobacterium BLCC-F154]|uniref:Response regulator transcription factor n=1 Tax=Floridaenema fluviatile BLCC-F154 TaxID=3153640 RepID=A0ABV4YKC2_9CYAN